MEDYSTTIKGKWESEGEKEKGLYMRMIKILTKTRANKKKHFSISKDLVFKNSSFVLHESELFADFFSAFCNYLEDGKRTVIFKTVWAWNSFKFGG